MRSLIIATLMILAASVANAEDCPLSGLVAQTWTAYQEFGTTPLNPFVWYLSPCTQAFPTGQLVCTNSVGYFGQWDVNGGSCKSLMDVQTTTWTAFTSSAGSGYFSQYTSSSKNTATVKVICDSSATVKLEAVGNVVATGTGPYNYTATVKTSACTAATPAPPTPVPSTGVPPTPLPDTAAPGPACCSGGCHGGCIFLIIFFVGGAVYVAGGVAWNFKNGKRGKELAPHPEFWLECVALVKDGCIFFAQAVCSLVDKCRGKSGGGGSSGEGSYSSV